MASAYIQNDSSDGTTLTLASGSGTDAPASIPPDQTVAFDLPNDVVIEYQIGNKGKFTLSVTADVIIFVGFMGTFYAQTETDVSASPARVQVYIN
jgi:hypothetical protein